MKESVQSRKNTWGRNPQSFNVAMLWPDQMEWRDKNDDSSRCGVTHMRGCYDQTKWKGGTKQWFFKVRGNPHERVSTIWVIVSILFSNFYLHLFTLGSTIIPLELQWLSLRPGISGHYLIPWFVCKSGMVDMDQRLSYIIHPKSKEIIVLLEVMRH